MSTMRQRTLALMRSRMEVKHLTESCTIEKQGDSEGSMGETLNDWSVVATDVSCRIIRAGQAMNSSNAVTGGRETLVDKLRCILPYNQEVYANYRILMSDGRRYKVNHVADDWTDKTFVTCIVERLRDKDG